jgi:hypothetical protein
MRESRSRAARSSLRLAALVATTVAACGAMLFAAATANAQTTSRTAALPRTLIRTGGFAETFVLHGGVTTFRGSFGTARFRVDEPDQTITCTLQVQNPHNSSHVKGTVNVVATIGCTAPVSGLAIAVGLYRNGTLVSTGSNSNVGSASIQANAAIACTTATYTGAADGAVIFPPGYEPPEGEFPLVYSPSIPISC